MKYESRLQVNFEAVYKSKPKKGTIVFKKTAQNWFPIKTYLPHKYLSFLGGSACKATHYEYDDVDTMVTIFKKNTKQSLSLGDAMLYQVVEEMNSHGWELFASDFDVINET